MPEMVAAYCAGGRPSGRQPIEEAIRKFGSKRRGLKALGVDISTIVRKTRAAVESTGG